VSLFAACNAIFGIDPGQPAGSSSAGSGGTGGGATVGSTATGVAASSSSTGGTGGTGGGAPCSGSALDGDTASWSRHAGGPYSTSGDVLAVTPDGSVIVGGNFADDETIFKSQPLPYPTPDAGSEGYDLFLAKYDKDGFVQWARPYGGRDHQWMKSLVVDPQGNLIIAGFFRGSVTFGQTTLDSDLDRSTSAIDSYVAKLDPDGDVLWARRYGGPEDDIVAQIAVDAAGNVIVAGNTAGGPVTGGAMADFGCGAKNTPEDTDQIFLTKLDPSGAALWCELYAVHTGYYNINNPPAGLAVTFDAAGNVVLAGGAYSGSFGQGSLEDFGDGDIFVFVADPAGKYLWAKTYGDENAQYASKVAIDPCGNIVLAGGFSTSVTLGAHTVTDPTDVDAGPSHDHIFLARLKPGAGPHDPAVPEWVEGFWDVGEQAVDGIAVGPGADVAIVGRLWDAVGSKGVDFGDGKPAMPSGPDQPGDYYRSDAFAAKFTPTGKLRWSKRWGGTDWDGAYAVALDGAGHTWVSGQFSEAVDFGKGPLSPNGQDMFLVQLGPP
jgi:hypothetical protein